MSKMIKLLRPELIDGQMRYPVEGPISVSDEKYDELIAEKRGEDVDGDGAGDDSKDPGDLEGHTVEDLKQIATDEGVDLQGATKKADLIAAIEAHRSAAS